MNHLQPVPRDNNLFRYRDRPEGEAIDIEVAYLKGSNRGSRGLYLYLRPVTVDEVSVVFNVFSGFRRKICALQRSSPALLRKVADAADEHVSALAALYRTDPDAASTQFNELALTLAGIASA